MAKMIHLKIYHGVRIRKKPNFALLFPPLSFIITPICFTQRCCKDVRSYLLLKSGVDTDLPTDQASSSAYQPVPLAPAWTSVYLLSV